MRHPSKSKMAIALMKKLADLRLNPQLYTYITMIFPNVPMTMIKATKIITGMYRNAFSLLRHSKHFCVWSENDPLSLETLNVQQFNTLIVCMLKSEKQRILNVKLFILETNRDNVI